jgi:hypothetical protein
MGTTLIKALLSLKIIWSNSHLCPDTEKLHLEKSQAPIRLAL